MIICTDMEFETFNAEDDQFGLGARCDPGRGAADCKTLEADILSLVRMANGTSSASLFKITLKECPLQHYSNHGVIVKADMTTE